MPRLCLGLVVACLWIGPTTTAAEDPTNCFSQVDESKWNLVIEHNATSASLSVLTAGAGPHVVTCLNRHPGSNYRISVVGDAVSQDFLHPWDHVWEGSTAALVAAPPVFNYLIFGGRYRLEFALCSETNCDVVVYSDYINIQSELRSWCESDLEDRDNSSRVETSAPHVEGTRGLFRFSFVPCSDVQVYDSANITMYEASAKEECGSKPVHQQTLPVHEGEEGNGLIDFRSPEVQGDNFYCVSVRLNHISCHLAAVDPPTFCRLESEPVWIRSRPWMARLIPSCTTELACLWLYLVAGGTVLLVISLVLAVACVRCCDTRTKAKYRSRHDVDQVDFSGEVLNLTSLPPGHRTWSEIHSEFEVGEERPRGKILLLYSPDTKLFKELQEAFKSFLEVACHCDIYDLFDDALFDTIALDPSVWLEEFVNDRDVKIIIISSIGAYRRQMALQGQMPLNLPENSLLDGLFTSGLRFVSNYPGLTSSGRVATARYEMLHLTSEGHGLQPPVGGNLNREFLIPTQLHDIFCWVHQLEPLDLMGKPWINYHLELQLLQDALKLVRRDRTLVGNCEGMGNGFTII